MLCFLNTLIEYYCCLWGTSINLVGELVRTEKRAIFNAGSGQVTFSHSSVVTTEFFCGLLHSCHSGLGRTSLPSLFDSLNVERCISCSCLQMKPTNLKGQFTPNSKIHIFPLTCSYLSM